MDYQEPIFKKVSEKPTRELTEEEIEEWIEKSKEYHENGDLAIGMHGGKCDSTSHSCCELCAKGHTIITSIHKGEISTINCTTYKCRGIYL